MLHVKAFRAPLAACLAAAFAACGPSADARVTRIITDRIVSPVIFPPGQGQDIPYETITGRAFGELDPMDSHNAIITDIALAQRNANGKVEYIATFFIVKPVDMSLSSGLMWHDVPNRGGRITSSPHFPNSHHWGLSSGWQGDNARPAGVPPNASTLSPVTPSNN